ncbi:GlsB/YeaQ/YmgE family stress response membrane protein [Aeoliella sp. ICT_H6.2]|uniref:GlsB/YeaQ/YmgE family stress response membrane protein n=1 Tax=Aeoliella straminimaris TaxID=2954799 RepID=A0A9X2JIL7_9BACT|nr:GlsB/YeaQ/YmgE family stress response membrane protein [Aeoliella straminimaris]MCO6045823.1 GlsB/YeaQ/YmgE family stress response membrane protein [Aeoliella straminimaris]
MFLFHILWFLLIGLAAGWLAGKFTRGGGFGLVGNLVVGVIGAVLGGLVIRLIGFSANGTIAELITATGGAVLFLYLLGWYRKKRQ